MHLARFLWNDRIRWGIVKGNDVWKQRGNLFRNARSGDYLGPLAQARILPPLERTNKIVAIAANYGEKDDLSYTQKFAPKLFTRPSLGS